MQRSINAASPGELVQIGAGEFRGRLVVRKSVTLVGAGAATVLRGVAGIDDAVIEVIDTADVVIADLTVSGLHEGIRIRGSTRVRVEQVVATDNGHEGIDVRQSNGVTVVGCECTQNISGGLRVREGSFDVLIDDCLIEQNLDQGVEVRDAGDVSVRNCVVRQNAGDGVRLRDSGLVDVSGNVIDANAEFGVRALSTPADATMLRAENQIVGNGEGDVRIEI